MNTNFEGKKEARVGTGKVKLCCSGSNGFSPSHKEL